MNEHKIKVYRILILIKAKNSFLSFTFLFSLFNQFIYVWLCNGRFSLLKLWSIPILFLLIYWLLIFYFIILSFEEGIKFCLCFIYVSHPFFQLLFNQIFFAFSTNFINLFKSWDEMRLKKLRIWNELSCFLN